MSLVAESVRTDIDLAGPFEPSTTFANREVREYFGVAERGLGERRRYQAQSLVRVFRK